VDWFTLPGHGKKKLIVTIVIVFPFMYMSQYEKRSDPALKFGRGSSLRRELSYFRQK